MGVINNDSFETDYGTTVVNSYVSVKSIELGRTPTRGHRSSNPQLNVGEWRLIACFSVWQDKNARLTGKMPYKSISINKILSGSELNVDIFTTVYNELKTILTNVTDDI